MAHRAKNNSILFSFLAGTAVGTGFALLTAPKTGKEMRETISEFTDESVTKLKDVAGNAQSKVAETFESGKNFFSEKKAIVSSAIQEGKHAMTEERERQRSQQDQGQF
jgi:gas vesicle protein